MTGKYRVQKFESLSSTNLYAASLIETGNAMDGLVIVAQSQTEGKGQDQNRWESKAGENLTFSILTRPEFLPPARQFMLTKVVSLAVQDFVSSVISDLPVRIKWPNDIYIGNKKVAGILISNTLMGNTISWSVIGVGLNVNQTVFVSDAPNPVSLKQLRSALFNLDFCLQNLLNYFDIRWQQLKNCENHKLDSDYQNSIYCLGEISKFIYKGSEIRAKITGTGAFGHLCLFTDAGLEIQCEQREIKMLVPPVLT